MQAEQWRSPTVVCCSPVAAVSDRRASRRGNAFDGQRPPLHVGAETAAPGCCVHGRYGNNALNGDWELGVTTNASAPPQHHINRTWAKGTKEPFTISFTSRRPRARSSRSVASGPRCSSRCPPARDIVRATAMALTVQSNGIVSADDGRLWVYAGVSDATRSDCWAMLRSSPIQTGRPWLTCLCPTIAPVGQSLAGMW